MRGQSLQGHVISSEAMVSLNNTGWCEKESREVSRKTKYHLFRFLYFSDICMRIVLITYNLGNNFLGFALTSKVYWYPLLPHSNVSNVLQNTVQAFGRFLTNIGLGGGGRESRDKLISHHTEKLGNEHFIVM